MFKKWYANNATNLSHVLMDGGKLSVPFDRLNEFYDVYIDAVTSGKKIYVVEQKSDTYNFFVDIDYKDPQPLGIDDIQDISKVICETVKFHGGKECLISVAKPKQCGSLVKTGVHLNWPGFVVDQARAARPMGITKLHLRKAGKKTHVRPAMRIDAMTSFVASTSDARGPR